MLLLFRFLAAIVVSIVKGKPLRLQFERELLIFLSIVGAFSLFYDLSLFGLFLSFFSAFILFRLGKERPESFISIVAVSVFLLPLRAFFPSVSVLTFVLSLLSRMRLLKSPDFSLNEILAFSLILLYALLSL